MMRLSAPEPIRPVIIRLCNWVGDVILTVPSFRLPTSCGA
jgi:hypothetical protein